MARRNFRNCHAALVLLLVAVVSLCTTAAAEEATAEQTSTTLRAMQDFQMHVMASPTPVILILHDEDPSRAQLWASVVKQLGMATKPYLIEVYAASLKSEVGVGLTKSFGMSPENPAILFFNGELEPVPDKLEAATKTPRSYTGEMSLISIVRWALGTISSESTELIDDDDDLVELFGKYPSYPDLPRVLYFSAKPYVSPMMLTIAQRFQFDAAFGALMDAFGTSQKKAIAKRYNVTKLPALVVLHRDGSADADTVAHLGNITEAARTEALLSFLNSQMPKSMDNIVAEAQRSGGKPDMGPLLEAQRRRTYILNAMSEKRVKRMKEVMETAVPKPVVVEDRETWEKLCLPRGRHCLVAFVDTGSQREVSKATETLQAAGQIVWAHGSGSVTGDVPFRLAIVDGPRNPDIVSYFDVAGVSYPSLVLLRTDTREYFTYQGTFDAESLTQFYINRTSSNPSVKGHRFIPRLVPKFRAAGDVDDADDGDL